MNGKETAVLFITRKTPGTAPVKLLACACAFLWMSPALAEKKTEWMMVQRDKSLGINDFYFCSTGAKIVDKNRGFIIVSKAPDWDIYFFRSDDKTLCRLTRQQYYNKNAYTSKHGMTPSRILAMVKIGPVTAPLFNGPYHNDVIKRFDGVPVQVEDLFACFHKSSAVDGIVLKSISNHVAHKPISAAQFMPADLDPTGVTRETVSLKEIPYNQSDFKIPSGFRIVSDLNKILTGAVKRQEAESIFLEMGVGDELGKPKGK